MEIKTNSLKNSAEINRAIFDNYYPNGKIILKNTSFATDGVTNRTLTSRTISDALSGDAMYRSPKFSGAFYNKVVNSSLNSLITGGSESVFQSKELLKIQNPESGLDPLPTSEDSSTSDTSDSDESTESGDNSSDDSGEESDEAAQGTLIGGAAFNRILAGSAISRQASSGIIDRASMITLADISNASKDPAYLGGSDGDHGDTPYPGDGGQMSSGKRTIALESALTPEEKEWLMERGRLLKQKNIVTDGNALTAGFQFDINNDLTGLTQTKTYYKNIGKNEAVEDELIKAPAQLAYVCPALIELLIFLESKLTIKGELGIDKAIDITKQNAFYRTLASNSSVNDHVFGRGFDITQIGSKDGRFNVDLRTEGRNVSKHRQALTEFLEVLCTAPADILPDMISFHSALGAEFGIIPDNEPVTSVIKTQYPQLKFVNFYSDVNHQTNIHFSFSAQRAGQYSGPGGELRSPGDFMVPAPGGDIGDPVTGIPPSRQPDLRSPKFTQNYADNRTGTISVQDVFDLLRGTLYSDEVAAIFCAILFRESSAMPANINGNYTSGDFSVGLFQINLRSGAHGTKDFYLPVGEVKKKGYQIGYKNWQRDGINSAQAFDSKVAAVYDSAGGGSAGNNACFELVDRAVWVPMNQAYMLWVTHRSGRPDDLPPKNLPQSQRLGAQVETGYCFQPWGDYNSTTWQYGFIGAVEFKDAYDVYKTCGKDPVLLARWVLSMFDTPAAAGSKSKPYALDWVQGKIFPVNDTRGTIQVPSYYPLFSDIPPATGGSDGGSSGGTPSPGGGQVIPGGRYPKKQVILPSDMVNVQNGKLPDSLLVEVIPRHGWKMHHKAARAYEAMRKAAKQEGFYFSFSGNPYRTYDEQVALLLQRFTNTFDPSRNDPNVTRTYNGQTWYMLKGMAPVASPGTSNHGWGLAVDLALDPSRDEIFQWPNDYMGAAEPWLLQHADSFGFSWELDVEPFHLRYWAGDNLPQRVLDSERGS